MKIKMLALIGCASAVLCSPAQAAVVIDGVSLEEGNLPGASPVNSTGTQTGQTVNGAVVQDGSRVSFTSNRDLTITGGGAATIAPLSGIIDLLEVSFENGWDQITFNFGRGTGVFDLTVNGGPSFFGGMGGNCDICTIGNGQNRFVVSGSGITSLAFNFRPGISSVTQFRVDGVSAVPEPATWAMMLLGFGFVGGAMRTAKRKQRATVAYA